MIFGGKINLFLIKLEDVLCLFTWLLLSVFLRRKVFPFRDSDKMSKAKKFFQRKDKTFKVLYSEFRSQRMEFLGETDNVLMLTYFK